MTYALALAGGGTRGAFQAGVWKALLETDICVTAICGTSVGAINGAVFASGGDAAALWAGITAEDIIGTDVGNVNLLSPSGLLELAGSGLKGRPDTSRLHATLEKYIDEEKVRRSGTEYGLCTYSATKKRAEELYLDDIPKGRLIDYIAASACFPLFKPVVIDGEKYTDGAVTNNLPANMLLRHGCKTIISVSVKGIGRVRDFDKCGVNVIEINSDVPEVGIMDFKPVSIRRSIESGYLECLKAFGRLSGKYFAVEPQSYAAAVGQFGKNLIDNIELAAKIIGCDRCRSYNAYELIRLVNRLYTDNPKLKYMVDAINKFDNDFVRKKLDLLGDIFDAANAIAYLQSL